MTSPGQVIYMRNVPGEPDLRVLTEPLQCLMGNGLTEYIPTGFIWNGNSVGPFKPFRHIHPIASCKHDYRCRKAKNAADRLWADQMYEVDIGTTSWWITKKISYLLVRTGALLGVGSNF